jgi:hypothetical protein
MKNHIKLLITAFCLSANFLFSQSIELNNRDASFDDRCALVLQRLQSEQEDYYRKKPQTGEEVCAIFKWSIDSVGSRLSLPSEEGRKAREFYSYLLKLCDNSKYAPWSLSRSLATTLMFKDYLSPDDWKAQKKLLQSWNYNCVAGTLNMCLYQYAAGYLASELWPDFKDSAVKVKTSDALDFRGKEIRSHSSSEIKKICRDGIYQIFKQFAVQNLVEHDVTYFECDLEAIKILADFSQDVEMKKRASMVMDYCLLQLALSWNKGYNIEPWFRTKLLPMSDNATVTQKLGWFYFGSSPLIKITSPYPPLIFANKGYRMPDILRQIALNRESEYVVRSTQFDPEKLFYDATFWKTFYHTPSYTLSTAVHEYDGAKGFKTGIFKETRLLNLTWDSGRPGSSFFVFQDNIRQPYLGLSEANDLGAGENPYGQRMQHKRTAIGIYDVPVTYPFYKQYTIYRKSDVVVDQIERDGWVFTHAGKMLFGFYSLMPTSWERNRQVKGISGGIDIRWCDARRNAWILETSDTRSYTGDAHAQLQAFAEKVLKHSIVDNSKMNLRVPELIYTSITGDVLKLVFGSLGESAIGKHFVNGARIDYTKWKTIDSPWAQQDLNSPIVTVNCDSNKLIYNFENWTIIGNRK